MSVEYNINYQPVRRYFIKDRDIVALIRRRGMAWR